jgi:pre-rRNA-processing protein TSR3
MALSYPPTIIVRHPNENPRKCSVLALRGRPDVIFFSYPVGKRPCLEGYIRLAADGPELTEQDGQSGLLLLDGSWRWAGSMTREFEDVPPRSLRGYRTAYPRVSRLGTDPDNGLASVEALFVAYHLLGRPTEGLLDQYRWAGDFLRLNSLTVDQGKQGT